MAEIFYHIFDPVYDNHSRVLVLGSFPSVKSREQGFYYGHPQNRFWKVLSAVFSSPVPQSIDEKKKLLLDNGVALWDVAQSCEINGSSDSSMKNVRPNDIYTLLYTTGIIYYRHRPRFRKRQDRRAALRKIHSAADGYPHNRPPVNQPRQRRIQP